MTYHVMSGDPGTDEGMQPTPACLGSLSEFWTLQVSSVNHTVLYHQNGCNKKFTQMQHFERESCKIVC